MPRSKTSSKTRNKTSSKTSRVDEILVREYSVVTITVIGEHLL